MKKWRKEVNQQTKINFVKGLKTSLNDLKNSLTTCQGFEIRFLKSFVNTLNIIRINEETCF